MSWPGSEKKSSTKKLISPSSSKTLQFNKNTLWNARNGQNAQKLNIDPKRWKAKNNWKLFGNDFRDEIAKNKYLTKNSFYDQILLKTLQINWNLLLENKYGQTKPNLIIGQKLLKHTKNILERVFVTKQQNTFLSIKNFLFKPILSKNASSQLKLAYKHQIQPNSTKTKTRSKTSKTDKNHWKPLMSGFHDLIATENLFNKKTVFHKNCPKRLEIII